MQRLMRWGLLVIVGMLAACGSSAPATPAVGESGVPGLQVMAGFRAEVYATGLRGPTALAYGPDGKLYVTQLNGPESSENAGQGQVVRIDAPGAAPIVVLDQLLKPTGLAWRSNELWLVTGRDVRQSLFDDQQLTPPQAVITDLPFNGRSNGQITLLLDGRLLFESSGGSDPNSAVLLTLKPGATTPEVFATGFKGAYAHTVDRTNGAIWTTEINDDRLAGSVPPDELNQLREGRDYGWPRCFGDQKPAPEHGATKESCEATEPPIGLFEPNASPTGVEWGGNTGWPAPYSFGLFVALWNGTPPRVALVQLGDLLVTKPQTFMSGLKRPMDLLAAEGGGLLVADFETGTIYRVTSEK